MDNCAYRNGSGTRRAATVIPIITRVTELVIGLVAAWAGSQYPAPEEGWIALTAVGGTHVERVTAFDAFAQDLYAQLRPPGAAVAAAADGHAVNEWVFGSRDVEADLPVTFDTVFGIASVAKSFTALAVADPVRQWLPEFRLRRAASWSRRTSSCSTGWPARRSGRWRRPAGSSATRAKGTPCWRRSWSA